MQERITIDISLRSILKVFGCLLGLWFLYAIRDIVLLFFLVIIIVMALAPIVNRWQQHMNRALAVGLLFVIILGVLSLIIGLILPPLITQVSELARNLPTYTEQIRPYLNTLSQFQDNNLSLTDQTLQTLSEQLNQVSRGLINTTIGVVGGLVSFLTVIVLSIYLLFEERGIRNMIVSLLPIDQKESVVNAIDKVGNKLGAWLRGQLFLMAVIGIVTTIWATILGLPYALTLGLWAGLTEVIPFIGPIIGGIPFVLIAFLESPLKGLIAIILLAVTQQVESNFIVPKVMQKSVGLSPVIVILALLIGGKLFGVTGAILSVPIAATISVIIQEWPKLTRRGRKKEVEEA